MFTEFLVALVFTFVAGQIVQFLTFLAVLDTAANVALSLQVPGLAVFRSKIAVAVTAINLYSVLICLDGRTSVAMWAVVVALMLTLFTECNIAWLAKEFFGEKTSRA